MKTLLYHRVSNRYVKQVLLDGFLKANEVWDDNIICFSRDSNYLKNSRPFVVIFDREFLKQKYKIIPTSFLGLHFNAKSSSYKRLSKQLEIRTESEERVQANKLFLKDALFYGNIC